MNFGSMAAGASAAYPGYVQGRSNLADMDTKEAGAQNALTQIAALAARGNAFKALFGDMQAPPMAMAPGVSSTPNPSAGGMAGGAPQPFMGVGGAPAASPVPQGGPTAPFAGAPGGITPQAPQQPPGGPPAVNESFPGGPGGQPPLTWQAIVSSLNKSNPGMKPEVLAAAVDQFAPMMSQESKLQWQMLSMQLKHEHQASLQDDRLRSAEGRASDRLTQQGAQFETRNARMEQQFNDRIAAMQKRQDELIAARDEALKTKEAGADRRTDVRQQGQNERLGLTLDTRRDVADQTDTRQRDLAGDRGERSDRQFGERQDRQDVRQRNSLQSREGEGAANRAQRQQFNDNRPTTATDKRIAIEAQRHQVASDIIDGAINDMQKVYADGFSATGVVGRGVRFKDFIQSLRGKDGEYAADAFVDKMRELRALLPRIYSGRSVTGKDERANLNALTEWASPGSTQVLTYNRLMEVQRTIKALAPKVTPSSPGTSTGGTGLKPITPELRANRQKAIDAGHDPAEVDKALRAKGYNPDGAP